MSVSTFAYPPGGIYKPRMRIHRKRNMIDALSPIMLPSTMITLSAYLKQNGVSIKAFAREIGVSRMTVHRWIRGQNRPDWDALERIKLVTGDRVTADSFMKSAVHQASNAA